MVVLGCQLDLMILEVLSNFNNSVILFYDDVVSVELKYVKSGTCFQKLLCFSISMILLQRKGRNT